MADVNGAALPQPDSMKKRPKVSVIMNCYNGAKYLREAIDSIYAQTFKDWEIIFWDNASTDNSAEIAKSYDERLKYFVGDKTVPLHAARNFALRQAKGKYIGFLDCDDIWLPQKLELQVPLFKKGKRTGLVYSNGYKLDIYGLKRINYKRIQPSGQIFRQLLRRYNLNMPTVMVFKEALDSLDHRFDESLNVPGDCDLFMRIARTWDVIYLPAPTAIYREHGENIHLSKQDIIPGEMEFILNKLSKMNKEKEFAKEYRFEIAKYRMRIQRSLLISMWKNGETEDLRRIVLGVLTFSGWFVLLYILSFFPLRLLSYLRKYVIPK
jgi:glycosyltransferase involved in cell wall biosynthesis